MSILQEFSTSSIIFVWHNDILANKSSLHLSTEHHASNHKSLCNLLCFSVLNKNIYYFWTILRESEQENFLIYLFCLLVLCVYVYFEVFIPFFPKNFVLPVGIKQHTYNFKTKRYQGLFVILRSFSSFSRWKKFFSFLLLLLLVYFIIVACGVNILESMWQTIYNHIIEHKFLINWLIQNAIDLFKTAILQLMWKIIWIFYVLAKYDAFNLL